MLHLPFRERQYDIDDQDFDEGPGGRMSAFGQEDLESRVLKKIKVPIKL